MTIEPTIQRDASSYRQGLVLGFTMAEAVLLLLFCLLLAASILFARERQQQIVTKKQLERALAELTPHEQRPKADLDDRWRRIIEAYDAVQSRGISVEVMTDTEYLSVIDKLRKRGLKPDEIEEGIGIADALAKGLQLDSLGELNVETVIQALTKAAQPGHQWPPIISLSEANGYIFATGSAALTTDFTTRLHSEVVDKILELSDQYGVDVIEVIGHTDEQALSGELSNLDKTLLSVVRGTAAVSSLVPADNAGLGVARAVAVAKELIADERLAGRTILPLSGAQLIEVGDRLMTGDASGDMPARRRIEIRVRRSADGESPGL